jgi:hypothetical protein
LDFIMRHGAWLSQQFPWSHAIQNYIHPSLHAALDADTKHENPRYLLPNSGTYGNDVLVNIVKVAVGTNGTLAAVSVELEFVGDGTVMTDKSVFALNI